MNSDLIPSQAFHSFIRLGLTFSANSGGKGLILNRFLNNRGRP